jgi:ATP-dependent exoDNAse (exonuclease V) beta subunit
MDVLELKHPHPRDSLLKFDEKYHSYKVGGVIMTSVTKFNEGNFAKFNASKVIKMMKQKEKESGSTSGAYYKKSAASIKKEWKQRGEAASDMGTQLHYDIEFYLNLGVHNEGGTVGSVEYGYFQNFISKFPLTPYRTEWRIFDEDSKLAGTIDAVFINKDGSLSMYDWKRSSGVENDMCYGKYGKKTCLKGVKDTKYNKYCLQLNFYKYILEKNYGFKVRDMQLLVMHPDNPDYQYIVVRDMSKIIKDLLK